MSAPHSSDGPLMHAEFMAFAGDEASFAVLRAFAERQGFPAGTVQMGGPDMFTQMLKQTPAPKLAIVDVDGQADPVAAASRLAGLCGADCKLIITGQANDVTLFRRMLTAGVADYLVKPFDEEALGQAYKMALRGGVKGEAKEAKIIVVMGSRGGVGTSTVAVNTGWSLAHTFKFHCVLLDLDLQYGTCALALDLEPGRGLRDLVTSPQRVDSLMVASSMVAESDGFSILSTEESLEEPVFVDSNAITALLKEMKGNFDFIIVDLPHHMFTSQKRLLAAAHEIVLIPELSLAGIRDTLRIKNALAALGSNARLTLAATRVSTSNPGQVDQTAFEKSAQVKIDLTIPEDSKSMREAANAGKALGTVAGESALCKALLTLATRLSGKPVEEKAEPKGFFGRILGSDKPKEAAKEKK